MLDTILSTVDAFTRLRHEPWQNLGKVLLVGEGNMSFAKSLFYKRTGIKNMTATTFEKDRNLSDEVRNNAKTLRCMGAHTIHGVDATKLNRFLKPQKFDTIIFQFPNAGSRDAKYGHTSNHMLLRNFLRSALEFINDNGRILISAVDNPHYNGIFKFDDAAKFANYNSPQRVSFDPNSFKGYSHVNTNDDKSALKGHAQFATWIFKPKT